MALVATDISFFPPLPQIINSNAASTFIFDASTDLIGIIFKVPKTGTISNVHYRIGSVTTPIATHRIELRTVDVTTGLPNASGTLYGLSTSITKDASTYTANTNYTAAINCTAATKGELCALIFDLSAFTSGSFTQVTSKGSSVYPAAAPRVSFPYGITNTTGSSVLDYDPIAAFSLEYSGGIFVPVLPSIGWTGSSGNTTVTSTGAVRRAGNAFTPAVKREATGFYVVGDFDGGVTFKIRSQLGDSVLASATHDKDVRGGNAQGIHYYDFDGETVVTLNAGTGYYILAEGDDATGGYISNLNSGVSQAMLDCMPGGQSCFGVTHNGTSYTNLTTANNVTRYAIGLLTDKEDDGTGGAGGLLTHPGMSGGMRG